jgi:hypothetical protein
MRYAPRESRAPLFIASYTPSSRSLTRVRRSRRKDPTTLRVSSAEPPSTTITSTAGSSKKPTTLSRVFRSPAALSSVTVMTDNIT